MQMHWIAKTLIIITALAAAVLFAGCGLFIGPKVGIAFSGICLLGELFSFGVVFVVGFVID